MKKEWTPHIIAAGALAVFIVLGLACATKPKPIEERKATWLEPKNNQFKIDRSMAAKNVPIEEQSFLFCDPGFEVKAKTLGSYKGGLVVLPVDTDRLWSRAYGKFEIEITFGSEIGSVLSFVFNEGKTVQSPRLEAGQFYWLFGPPWVHAGYTAGYSQAAFLVLPLNEEGIEIFAENTWNKSKNDIPVPLNNRILHPNSTKDEWSSYEEYRDFIKQLWELRKEEARKQLGIKK